MIDLVTIKGNRDLLLAELGLDKPGQHLRCPFHSPDDAGSLSVFMSRNGAWLWKCHAGCGSGSIVDAVQKSRNLTSIAEAMRALEDDLGIKVDRKEADPAPNLDGFRAKAFVEYAHRYLIDSLEVQEKWMLAKRGIASVEILERYQVGFVEQRTFKGWRQGPDAWKVTGWVLPITDADGRLQGVKLHNEVRFRDMPKSLWAPFGKSEWGEKPKHGYATLWPPPEHFAGCESMILCPGELKALAFLAAGKPATSPTAGESTSMLYHLRRIPCETVFISYDDDDTGRKWLESMSAELQKIGKRPFPFEFVGAKGTGFEPGRQSAPAGASPSAPIDLDTLDAEWQSATGPPPENSIPDFFTMPDLSRPKVINRELPAYATLPAWTAVHERNRKSWQRRMSTNDSEDSPTTKSAGKSNALNAPRSKKEKSTTQTPGQSRKIGQKSKPRRRTVRAT